MESISFEGQVAVVTGGGRGLGRARLEATAVERMVDRRAELEADVIVTATGLNLLALGGMELAVDGSGLIGKMELASGASPRSVSILTDNW